MTRASTWVGTCLVLLLKGVVLAQSVGGRDVKTEPVSVQRLHGVIDKKQTWSGTVLITDSLSIEDVTVTVAPGTTIEFANSEPGTFPVLRVGGMDARGGRLEIDATAENPVTIRTRLGTNAGRLIVHLRGPGLGATTAVAQAEDRTPGGASNAATRPSGDESSVLRTAAPPPAPIVWRHVRFEGLGPSQPKHILQQTVQLAEPAVSFQVSGAAELLNLSDCSFDKCARVNIRASDGCEAQLSGNRFSNPTERASLELENAPSQPAPARLRVTGNRMAGAVRISGPTTLIADNLIIGRDAAIMIDPGTSSNTEITDNWIHNTTPDDDGHYCLSSQVPDVLIRANVFRGATTCVLSGSRRMSDNVMIGAPRLTSPRVKNARTHHLIAGLPSGSIFENNLLLGPAYSLLAPQSSAAPQGEAPKARQQTTVIRHNVFDGFDGSSRAIHLNALGFSGGRIAVTSNVLLRVPSIVFDENSESQTLSAADYNAIVPRPDRPYDRAKATAPPASTWGEHDLRVDDAAALRLAGSPLQTVPDFDEELLAGKSTVRQVREKLVAPYRPQAGSPLLDANNVGKAAGSGGAARIGPVLAP